MWLKKQRILDTLKSLASLRLYLTRLSMPFIFLVAAMPAPIQMNSILSVSDDYPTRGVGGNNRHGPGFALAIAAMVG